MLSSASDANRSFGSRDSPRVTDIETLISATRIELASDMLSAISGLLAISVILRITSAQRRALRGA